MDVNTKQMKNPFGFAFYIVLVPEKFIVTKFIFSIVIKLNQKCLSFILNVINHILVLHLKKKKKNLFAKRIRRSFLILIPFHLFY